MRVSGNCAICDSVFIAARSDKRTCSPACKKALQRGGWKIEPDIYRRGRPRKARHGAAKRDKTPSLCPVLEPAQELAQVDLSCLEARKKRWPQDTEIIITEPDGVCCSTVNEFRGIFA